MKAFYYFVLLALVLWNAPASANSWKHKSELGITSVTGNGTAMNVNADHLSVREKEKNTYTLQGQYRYGEADDLITSRYWLGRFRFDHSLSQSWKYYLGFALEGDKFNGYSDRSHTDIGAKHDLMKKGDNDYFFYELGYRFTYENEFPDNPDAESSFHKTRVFAKYAKTLSETLYAETWLEWLKTIDNDNRNELNFEISANSKLSQTLALKVAYLVNYIDTLKDRGFRYNTKETFTTSLIANY